MHFLRIYKRNWVGGKNIVLIFQFVKYESISCNYSLQKETFYPSISLKSPFLHRVNLISSYKIYIVPSLYSISFLPLLKFLRVKFLPLISFSNFSVRHSQYNTGHIWKSSCFRKLLEGQYKLSRSPKVTLFCMKFSSWLFFFPIWICWTTFPTSPLLWILLFEANSYRKLFESCLLG